MGKEEAEERGTVYRFDGAKCCMEGDPERRRRRRRAEERGGERDGKEGKLYERGHAGV